MPVTTARLTRRSLLVAGAAALVGCGTPQVTPAAGAPRLRLLGENLLRHRMPFRGTPVGGLSGLDFDPASGRWIALSDDRSELAPARFYTLRLDFGEGWLRTEVADVTTLRQAGGDAYPPRRLGAEVVDPEAVRLLPNGNLLWTSEGDSRVKRSPSLNESGADGRLLREFVLPAELQFAPGTGRGPRDNATLEGLALTPDARTAWIAMEGPLEQDGPVPRVGAAGGACRFTAIDLASGRALRQLAYVPDAIPFPPIVPGGFADNGVSEVLMLDAHRMLVLERAFALGPGISLRLYEIDTRDATDTLAMPTLAPGAFRPAPKRLVADFSQLGLSRLDNTESLAWGPPLPNGRRTLVVVSDDNFLAAQVTQFAAFEYLD